MSKLQTPEERRAEQADRRLRHEVRSDARVAEKAEETPTPDLRESRKPNPVAEAVAEARREERRQRRLVQRGRSAISEERRSASGQSLGGRGHRGQGADA